MSGKNQKNQKFEDAFRDLETLVERLEKGETSLEESIRVFEEGMKLVNFCSQKLNETESRIQKLVQDEEGQFRLDILDEKE